MFGTYCRLDVHVFATNREVIRAASLKLKKSVRYRHAHRDARHAFYRAMLDYHKTERALLVEYRL
jgi:hypothetical protein